MEAQIGPTINTDQVLNIFRVSSFKATEDFNKTGPGVDKQVTDVASRLWQVRVPKHGSVDHSVTYTRRLLVVLLGFGYLELAVPGTPSARVGLQHSVVI